MQAEADPQSQYLFPGNARGKPLYVKPHTIRIGQSTPKGYESKDFEDAFARYVPPKRNTATGEEEETKRPKPLFPALPKLRPNPSEAAQGYVAALRI